MIFHCIEIARRYAGLRLLASRASRKDEKSMMSFLSKMSMIGLIIGVALLYTVLSVMNGFDREMRTKIVGIVPQGVVYLDDPQQRLQWRATQRELESLAGVASADGFASIEGMFVSGEHAAAAALVGLDLKSQANQQSLGRYIRRAGSLDDRLDSQSDNPIFLGEGLMQSLKLAVGDELTLIAAARLQGEAPQIYRLRAAGVLATETEVDNQLALIDLEKFASLGEPITFASQRDTLVQGLRLRFDDIFSASQIVNQVVRDSGYALRGDSWMRTHGNLYHAILMSKRIVSVLMALIIAIAAFNVVSSLILVIMDKRGDIAIMRTMGTRKRHILLIFLSLGLFIGLIGAMLGLAIGALLSWLTPSLVQFIESLTGFAFLQSDVYPITYIPVDLRLADAIQLFVTVIALTFVATLFPAWRAARIQPAKALRYE